MKRKVCTILLALGFVSALGLSAWAMHHMVGSRIGSTWPVTHQDLANRDFVPLAGPKNLVPKWHALEGRADAALVAIDDDGNLYTVTMDEGPCHLWSLDPGGNVRWCSEEVRAAYTVAAVGPDGAIYISDANELFRFESDGTIAWRVPTDSFVVTFSPDGYLITISSLTGDLAAHDPATGDKIAEIDVPADVLPRPDPLPLLPTLLGLGATDIGIAEDYVDRFIDQFFDYEVAVGNNVPTVDPETGRVFMAVAIDPDDPAKGVFYAYDFNPPTADEDASFSLACEQELGPLSATSAAISADGNRIYVGDSVGPLTAFNTEGDCSPAWTLVLPAPSLASPTVGLDGRLYMNVGGEFVCIRDNVTVDPDILWTSDLVGFAQAQGYDYGRLTSVIALTPNYLYVAVTLFKEHGPLDVPFESVIATVDPDTGEIVSTAPIEDAPWSVVSMGADGALYAPSKPLFKGVAKGYEKLADPPFGPLPWPAPDAVSGVSALEPASYEELSVDGIDVALSFTSSVIGDLEDLADLKRAINQVIVVGENLARAKDRGEIDHGTFRVAQGLVGLAEGFLRAAEDLLERDHLSRWGEFVASLSLQLARASLEAAGSVLS